MYSGIVERVSKYFSLKEFVSKTVYDKYGEQAWSFLDPRLLDVIVWLRESMGIPLVCNNWATGGQYQQRGYRENTCEMVSAKTKSGKTYCSAHTRGQGIDLSSGRANAETIRQWIRTHIEDCPWEIRLEEGVNWVHIDVCNASGKKLEIFKV